MVSTLDTGALRKSSVAHNWMHMQDWVRMAEEGDPLIIVGGEGVRVTDSDGNTWMDVNGGYLSVNIGYGRKEIADAAFEQLKKITFAPVGSTTEPVVRFAEKLTEITPGSLSRVWPTTGGSESNEIAVKIAKAYHHRNGEPGRYKIISRRGSYHGATGLTMWLGGYGSGRADYEPAYPGMIYAPQPNPYRCEVGGDTPSEIAVRCAKAVEDLILFHGADTIAAMIAEPICADTATDACSVPGPEYWPMLREICSRYGVLLIADEVICGFGRTGRYFGINHWGVEPDIMTVAKGVISSYLPMAAVIAGKHVADAFAGEDNVFPSVLTFGGHPVVSAAALANIKILEEENMIGNSAAMGAYLLEQLEDVKGDHPIVGDVRGLGLLATIEIVKDRDTKERFPAELDLNDKLAEKFHRRRLIVRPRGTITLSPPLCVTRDEIDEIVEGIDGVLGETERELGITV